MGKLNSPDKQARLQQLMMARSLRTPAPPAYQPQQRTRSAKLRLPSRPLWTVKTIQIQDQKLVLDVDTMQRLRANYVSLTLIGTVLSGRMLGILRDFVFETTFDSGNQLIAFMQAQFASDLIFNLVTCCALALALLPLLAHQFSGTFVHNPGWPIMKTNFSWDPFGWQGLKTILLMALGLLCGVALLLVLLAPWLVGSVLYQASGAQSQLAIALFRLTLFQALLTGGAALLGFGVGNRDYGPQPAIGAVLALLCGGLGLLIGVICLMVKDDTPLAINCMGWGLGVGACLQLGLHLPGLARGGLWYLRLPHWQRPALSLPDRTLLKRVCQASLLYLSALWGRNLLVLLLFIVASQVLQTLLLPPSYFLQLVLLPAGLLGLVAATVSFPLLVEYVTSRGGDATLLVPLRPLFFLILPLSCLACIMIFPSLPQSGGSAFLWLVEASPLAHLPLTFVLLAPGMQGALEVSLRSFWSDRRGELPPGAGALLLLLRILVGIYLLLLAARGLLWGLAVLVLMGAWTLTFETACLLWLVYQRSKWLDLRQGLDFTWRVLLATGTMVPVCLALAMPLDFLVRWLSATGLAGALVQASALVIEIVVGFYIYVRVARMLHIPEAGWLARLLRR